MTDAAGCLELEVVASGYNPKWIQTSVVPVRVTNAWGGCSYVYRFRLSPEQPEVQVGQYTRTLTLRLVGEAAPDPRVGPEQLRKALEEANQRYMEGLWAEVERLMGYREECERQYQVKVEEVAGLEAEAGRLRGELSANAHACGIQMDQAREAEAQASRLRTALCDLLAIIHRDGGHHTGKVGEEQSVKDAHQVWAGLMLENEQLKAASRKAEHEADLFYDLLTDTTTEYEEALLQRAEAAETKNEQLRAALEKAIGAIAHGDHCRWEPCVCGAEEEKAALRAVLEGKG